MTINDIKEYVYKLARQRQIGNFSIDLFNLCLEASQLEFIEQNIGDSDEYQNSILSISQKGAEVTQTVIDALGDLVTQQTITVTTQQANKPSNYLYKLNLEHYTVVSTDPCASPSAVSSWVGIDLKRFNHRNYILNSTIVYPTKVNPVAFNFASFWEIHPSGVNEIKLQYIRKPLKPKWAYTIVSNNYQFDAANSQGLEIPEQFHEEVCHLTLKRMAASIRDNELMNATNELKK